MKPSAPAKIIFVTGLLLALLLPAAQAKAQAPEGLNLRLIRNFGFGGFGQIQGTFTLRITNPEGLVRAAFYLDDELVGTAEAVPFEYRFHTGDHPPGYHEMAAIGYTAAGEALASNRIGREFLTAEGARRATAGLILPVLGLVAILALASALIPFLLGRGKQPTPGVYGRAGGAVCPRCGLPYTRHVLAPNLLAGKLERCPYCGKWAVVARASPETLAAAEARLRDEREESTSEPESEAARLRRMIEDSRYED